MGPRALPAGLTAAALVLAGCGGGAGEQAGSPTRTTAGRARTVARPALCGPVRATVLGTVTDPASTELSGLALSHLRPGVLWAEADSGAAPVLTALDRRARPLGHVTVTGAQNVDWEDLAALRTQARGSELLAADIGDNDGARDHVTVYRVPEPDPGASATAPAAALTLRYPDGRHDAETLIADPVRDQLVIVTKGLFGGRVYTTSAAFAPGAARMLHRGPALALGLVTAGDVTSDGRIVALRSYAALWVWRRRGREPLARTLARAPCTSPAHLGDEGQGEALALADGGRAAYTAPETVAGRSARLRRYAPG